MKLLRIGLVTLLLVLLAACGNSTPPPRDAAPVETSSASPTPPAVSSLALVVDAGPAADAGGEAASVDAGPAADAGSVAPAAIVADNKVEPTEGPELQERAKGLFEAIVKDDPELGEPFWFPREPFIPLKDVKEPGKYWTQLHRSFVGDIHKLHEKRKSWGKAEFVRFDGWTHPKWVKPGDEANKIGYHRAFRGKIHYKVDGQDGEIEVRTIITWQGRWFITHLSKFKH